MMKSLHPLGSFRNVFFTMIISLALLTCRPSQGSWQQLFNGTDLNNWNTYVGPLWDTVSNGFNLPAPGVNNDPHKVFTVTKKDGAEVIRISGEDFGGISTTDEYHNYHLQVEFKWGELKWAPRADDKRDNGVLYHAVGPVDTGDEFWMRSHEFQVEETDCGDYWGVQGASMQTYASAVDSVLYKYDPAGELMTFGDRDDAMNRRLIKSHDGENPTGQWNTLDLYCYGDTSIHVVNGQVVMVLYELSQPEGDKHVPLRAGKIQIQSEGAEIFYRSVQLEFIEHLPQELLQR